MTKLNHESILFCRDVFETPDIIYLVLELYVTLSALSNDEAFLAEKYMIKLSMKESIEKMKPRSLYYKYWALSSTCIIKELLTEI